MLETLKPLLLELQPVLVFQVDQVCFDALLANVALGLLSEHQLATNALNFELLAFFQMVPCFDLVRYVLLAKNARNSL